MDLECRLMPAGLYRDQVDIQQDSSAAGAPVPVYTGGAKYAKVPCDIVTVSGDETFRGKQLEAHLSHVVEMQYMPDVDATMRLSVTGGTLTGRTLEIVQVRPLDFNGRMRKLQLYCLETPST